MTQRIGLGYDVHPFDAGRPLVLGGVTLPSPGLAGHSDADLAAHAVADALLSAGGLPDLGTLYPATDDRWRGIASLELVRDVAERLAADGWHVLNVDLVLNAETPRLAPHLDAMRANVAAALAAVCEPGAESVPVTITPKRGEGIGMVGRNEGMQGWAVVLLERSPPGAESRG
jgi:2-C-methyl-D-erythritol 2,4-cyclodiphosphate synthase